MEHNSNTGDSSPFVTFPLCLFTWMRMFCNKSGWDLQKQLDYTAISAACSFLEGNLQMTPICQTFTDENSPVFLHLPVPRATVFLSINPQTWQALALANLVLCAEISLKYVWNTTFSFAVSARVDGALCSTRAREKKEMPAHRDGVHEDQGLPGTRLV